MKWTWQFESPAEKDLRRIDRQHRGAILAQLDALAQEMTDQGRAVQANTKKLKGLAGEYRLRVGDFRVRFGLDTQECDDGPVGFVTEGVIVVYHVMHRREGLKKASFFDRGDQTRRPTKTNRKDEMSEPTT